MLLKKFLLLLLLLNFSTLFAENIQDRIKVVKIHILPQNIATGSSFDSNTILTRMKTKEGGFFSQSDFDEDLKNLSADYDRIDPTMEVSNKEAVITMKVWIKPKIHAIIFQGNQVIKSSKLQKELDLEVNSTFKRDEFLENFNKLKVYYLKKGFFEAHLTYEILSLGEGNEIDILIKVVEGRSGKIAEVEFQGITEEEEKELRELTLTKKHNLFLSWYTGSGSYQPEMIERDRMVILEFLQNKGFADAVVDITVVDMEKKNKILLRVSVDKGITYRVGSISFSGNTLFPAEEIRAKFKFREKGIFSPEKIRITVKEIKDLYGAKGYIDANIDVALHLRADEPLYDVILTIEEGVQYTVGMIRVFGNNCTQARVILNESQLCPGEVFDIRKLEATETRLCNTGYFGNVNAYAVAGPTDGGCCCNRDVFIEVDETDTGNLGLFFGFSSLDSIFGGVDITERNFNICGIPHLLNLGPAALRGGGEYLHLKANIGNRQTSYLMQWTQPYFLDTPWIVGFDLEKRLPKT